MERRYFCVDRVENGIAAAYSEDGEKVEIVPDAEPFKAGDMIYFDGECFVKDEKLTSERKRKLSALKKRLTDR